jgi:hypothetical protein
MWKTTKFLALWAFGVMILLGSLAFSGHLDKKSDGKINTAIKINKQNTSGILKIDLPSPHPELNTSVYKLALQGYHKLSVAQKITRQLLTIVDFSKPSSEKRMFIIDMAKQEILFYTYVSHGSNSGEKMATRFSNTDATHQSSLGFYLTGATYMGGNGYSLKLKGLEPGFNDKAESRAIVMHGAPYVSETVIKNTGRLGRSWGCPAVSKKEHKQIIDLVKGGSCLFIYAPQKDYLAASSFLKDSLEGEQML